MAIVMRPPRPKSPVYSAPVDCCRYQDDKESVYQEPRNKSEPIYESLAASNSSAFDYHHHDMNKRLQKPPLPGISAKVSGQLRAPLAEKSNTLSDSVNERRFASDMAAKRSTVFLANHDPVVSGFKLSQPIARPRSSTWDWTSPNSRSSSSPSTSRKSRKDFFMFWKNRSSEKKSPEIHVPINSQVCQSCLEPFDSGKKRKLIDSCGHERCYSCMFSKDMCNLCHAQGQSEALNHHSSITDFSPFRRSYVRPQLGGSPASRSCQMDMSPLRSFRSRPESPTMQQQPGRVFATPPAPRRRYVPSPKPSRPSWMQRHFSRRPQTVNVDDATLSDDNSSGRASTRGSIRRPEGHLTAAHFARSSSLGVPRVSSTTNPGPLSHESGFQSCTSLNSIGGPARASLRSSSRSEMSPVTSRNPVLLHIGSNPASASGSMASLASGTQSNFFPAPMMSSTSNLGKKQQILSNPAKSVTSSNDELGSRLSMARSSARLPSTHEKQTLLDPRVQFAQYCQQSQQHWLLKPLFFEVPQRELHPVFVGRQWLYAELSEHLSSDLPTNRGVIIAGGPGTGKTALMLKMVELSCFGRGEPIYQEVKNGSVGSRSPTSPSHAKGQHLPMVASQVVAYHFCQADNIPTCSVPEFVHSLAAQLSQSPAMKSYYQLLTSDSRIRSKLSVSECTADPNESFCQGILEPMNKIYNEDSQGHGQCIILVDGLDEAELVRPDRGDTIGSFLCRHLHRFPVWLKIVCTVRSDSLATIKGLPFHQISLDKSEVDERLKKDMVDYIESRVQQSAYILNNITPLTAGKPEGTSPPQIRFIHYLTDRVNGCFLFAKLVLDLIEKGHLVIKSSSFKVLPVTLAEVFLLEFNLKFPTIHSYDKISDILSVCLASLVPMTVSDIYNSVNALSVEEEWTWTDFVSTFNMLTGFLVRRADDTVMFYHPIFREWLVQRRDGDSDKFLCDPRIGHLAIALRLSRQKASTEPEKTLELAHHVLKTNLYTEGVVESPTSRHLQSVWMALGRDDLSQALSSHSNIYCPNIKVSRLLLRSGASPNAATGCLQNAPLVQVFAHEGYEEMVSLLIEFGANVNCRNADGKTPLMSACLNGHADTVRLLIQHGASVNVTDNFDKCSLVYAAEAGHLDIVELLVSCDWHCLKKSDLSLIEAAQQALVATAAKGHTEVLEYLLDMAEISIDGNDTLSGDSPMCSAAAAGQKASCEVLLRRGANINGTNLQESAPLHLANRFGHWSVAVTLLKEGADKEQKDGGGRTPLMIAAMEGHLGLVELLLSRGTNIDAQDKDGITSLGWACLKGQIDTASYLIAQNANVATVDRNGRTPLDLAAYQGNPDVVNLLLEHGALMEHVDLNGMRPLDRAISCRNASAVQCFLKKGAKLGPATWAMASGKPDIMLLLLNKLLEDGNTLFKKEQISEAAHRYQYALRRIPSTPLTKSSSTKTTFDQLTIHLLLNLSRCKRRCGQIDEALELADKVLSINPSSFEAHYAKAKANRESGRLPEALADLTAALKVAPQNREVHRIILRIKEEIHSQKRATSSSSCRSSSDSCSSPTPNLNDNQSSKLALKSGLVISRGETEMDSTSGVDSTGSSGSAKDFNHHDLLSTSLVI